MLVTCICTGNTCRSPMAAALLTRLAQERGLLITVRSAGLAADDGSPAASHAVETMAARGLTLSSHRASSLTPALFAETDRFLVMSPAHRQWLIQAGADPDRITVLGGGIPDPFGSSLEVYAATADRLETALNAWLDTVEEDSRG